MPGSSLFRTANEGSNLIISDVISNETRTVKNFNSVCIGVAGEAS